MTPAAIQAFLTARTQRRRTGTPSTHTRRRATAKASALYVLNHIRGHRHCIGGYAARFDMPYQRVVDHRLVREVVKAGAFGRALAAGGWFLLLDHLNAEDDGALSVASMTAGTLHVVEDVFGLWFEAALPDGRDGAALFERVCRSAIVGASTGASSVSVRTVNGTREVVELAAWEISLVTPPNRPARVGTFCKPNAEARRERSRLMRLA